MNSSGVSTFRFFTPVKNLDKDDCWILDVVGSDKCVIGGGCNDFLTIFFCNNLFLGLAYCFYLDLNDTYISVVIRLRRHCCLEYQYLSLVYLS